MPEITLTWNAGIFTPRDATPYGFTYIYQFQLRNAGNALIPMQAKGVYVIERNGSPIYAGEAGDIRTRFDDRGRVLREFGLQPTAALPNRTVRYATVAPTDERALAERWLVRILYLCDQGVNPHVLQNVDKTGSFTAPEDGLTIHNEGTRPNYLNAVYDYDADEAI